MLQNSDDARTITESIFRNLPTLEFGDCFESIGLDHAKTEMETLRNRHRILNQVKLEQTLFHLFLLKKSYDLIVKEGDLEHLRVGVFISQQDSIESNWLSSHILDVMTRKELFTKDQITLYLQRTNQSIHPLFKSRKLLSWDSSEDLSHLHILVVVAPSPSLIEIANLVRPKIGEKCVLLVPSIVDSLSRLEMIFGTSMILRLFDNDGIDLNNSQDLVPNLAKAVKVLDRLHQLHGVKINDEGYWRNLISSASSVSRHSDFNLRMAKSVIVEETNRGSVPEIPTFNIRAASRGDGK